MLQTEQVRHTTCLPRSDRVFRGFPDQKNMLMGFPDLSSMWVTYQHPNFNALSKSSGSDLGGSANAARTRLGRQWGPPVRSPDGCRWEVDTKLTKLLCCRGVRVYT